MKNIYIIIIILFFVFCSFSNIKAQKDSLPKEKKIFSIAPKFQYGYILAHHASFDYLIKKHPYAFELNVGFPATGKKMREHVTNFPTLGFGFYHANLGNKEILGTVYSFYTYINGPIFKIRKYSLNYNVEMGLSYLPLIYDYQTNYINFAISTHFNVHANLNFESHWKINNKLTLFSGIGVTHYSNGAVRMPNPGINVVSFSSGLIYTFNQTKPPVKIKKPKFIRYFDLSLIQTIGVQARYPTYKQPYFLSAFTADFGRRIGFVSRFGIGGDIFYNSSVVENFETDSIFNSTKKDYFYGGIHVSWDINYGRMSFTIHQGIYLWQKFNTYKNIYERFGFRYKFDNNIILNITLITYYASAQFIEWGIGYNFDFKK